MSRTTERSDGFGTREHVLLGSARVSILDQDTQLQLDALQQVPCDRIYTDHASGAATARPRLDELLGHARRGDTILVWRLDRLGRSMKHLIDLVGELQNRGVGLRSLNEQTTPPRPRVD